MTVGPDGEFDSVNDAIRAAKPGDVIAVQRGVVFMEKMRPPDDGRQFEIQNFRFDEKGFRALEPGD